MDGLLRTGWAIPRAAQLSATGFQARCLIGVIGDSHYTPPLISRVLVCVLI